MQCLSAIYKKFQGIKVSQSDFIKVQKTSPAVKCKIAQVYTGDFHAIVFICNL